MPRTQSHHLVHFLPVETTSETATSFAQPQWKPITKRMNPVSSPVDMENCGILRMLRIAKGGDETWTFLKDLSRTSKPDE